MSPLPWVGALQISEHVCPDLESRQEPQQSLFCSGHVSLSAGCHYIHWYIWSLLLFNGWVMLNSSWPHGLQHARLPCPSLSPRVSANSYPLSQWCHPTILSLVIPFSSCPQSFPASESFSVSPLCIRWPKYWRFAFSISPSNEYAGLISSRIHWFDLLTVQGTLKSLLQHHSSKASILWLTESI